MIDDEKIIELFSERSEQAIRELDKKYGKICHSISYSIVNSSQDAEECVNDAYLGVLRLRQSEADGRCTGSQRILRHGFKNRPFERQPVHSAGK